MGAECLDLVGATRAGRAVAHVPVGHPFGTAGMAGVAIC